MVLQPRMPQYYDYTSKNMNENFRHHHYPFGSFLAVSPYVFYRVDFSLWFAETPETQQTPSPPSNRVIKLIVHRRLLVQSIRKATTIQASTDDNLRYRYYAGIFTGGFPVCMYFTQGRFYALWLAKTRKHSNSQRSRQQG